ncbi:hypothetical protein [uncultured Parolsenella sp.]|nr:hypothetical protein [uncultured Parolsenella sp.]
MGLRDDELPLVALPQLAVLLAPFFLAGAILPLTDATFFSWLGSLVGL